MQVFAFCLQFGEATVRLSSLSRSLWTGCRLSCPTANQFSTTSVFSDSVRLHTRWSKKTGHRLIAIILSNINRFQIYFFILRFLSKFFAVKWISKIPPHFACVATLPCETLMSAKQAINDKLQGSVATYLRCGEVVNNQIKKGLLLSVSKKLKSVHIWRSYKQERGCFIHFAHLANSLLIDEMCHKLQ